MREDEHFVMIFRYPVWLNGESVACRDADPANSEECLQQGKFF